MFQELFKGQETFQTVLYIINRPENVSHTDLHYILATKVFQTVFLGLYRLENISSNKITSYRGEKMFQTLFKVRKTFLKS